jgi:hypothetical protein
VFSLEIAVRMRQDVGYPIEDITEEIDRIQRRSFDHAARLADATGDKTAVREYLQLPKAGPGVQQVPLIPGQTPPAGQPAANPPPPSVLVPPGKTGEISPAEPGPR